MFFDVKVLRLHECSKSKYVTLLVYVEIDILLWYLNEYFFSYYTIYSWEKYKYLDNYNLFFQCNRQNNTYCLKLLIIVLLFQKQI